MIPTVGGPGSLGVPRDSNTPLTGSTAPDFAPLQQVNTDGIALCVQLDRALIRTDLLSEGVLLLFRQNPWLLLLVLFWAIRGRACLQQNVWSRVEIEPESLPYQRDFLDFLRERFAGGDPIVLATAGNLKAARAVADHLGIFQKVVDTSVSQESLQRTYGPRGYDVALSSHLAFSAEDDLDQSRQVVLVNPSASLKRKLGPQPIAQTFDDRRSKLKVLAKALRVYQWVKNVLVFTPLLTSHRLFELDRIEKGIIAFIAFSFCASSVYILNDLLDVRSDRLHAVKRKRPFAAGDLSWSTGLVLVMLLLTASVGTAFFLSWQFQVTLAIYYCLTLAYSLSLKSKMLVDVYVLGGLYTLRVLAGGAATSIVPSPWLLAFCLFFFVSLALVKRFSELHAMRDKNVKAVPGRSYFASDIDAIGSLGTSSGFMCVLVLTLYINSDQVRILYQTPSILWFLCPILMYWISRVWLMTYRGEMNADPILFALQDKMSYVTVLGCAIVLLAAAQGIRFR